MRNVSKEREGPCCVGPGTQGAFQVWWDPQGRVDVSLADSREGRVTPCL